MNEIILLIHLYVAIATTKETINKMHEEIFTFSLDIKSKFFDVEYVGSL
jgi:hypothetical protein